MPKIHRSALVTHSAQAMFDLVNDVPSYPEFLPGCIDAQVLSESVDEVVARLQLAKGRLSQQFTTRNRLLSDPGIDMQLVDGPFSKFRGLWRFDELQGEDALNDGSAGNTGCKVSLDLDFEFSNALMSMMFGKVFNDIANNLVDAFCQRADEVHGQ